MIKALVYFCLIQPIIIFAQNQCNICQKESNAACYNETTFSICMDDKATDDFIVCPEEYQCTDGMYVCYPKANSIAACVSNVGSSTTTTAAPRDANTMCQDLQVKGRFPNEMDLTCGSYVYCRNDGNGWTGQVFSCGSNMWFFGTTCTSTKPDTCL